MYINENKYCYIYSQIPWYIVPLIVDFVFTIKDIKIGFKCFFC